MADRTLPVHSFPIKTTRMTTVCRFVSNESFRKASKKLHPDKIGSDASDAKRVVAARAFQFAESCREMFLNEGKHEGVLLRRT